MLVTLCVWHDYAWLHVCITAWELVSVCEQTWAPKVYPGLPLSSLIIAEGDDGDVVAMPNSMLLCQLKSARPPRLNSATVVWPCAYLSLCLGLCSQFMASHFHALPCLQVKLHITSYKSYSAHQKLKKCYNIKSRSKLVVKERASTIKIVFIIWITQVYGDMSYRLHHIKLTRVGDVILNELLVSVL